MPKQLKSKQRKRSKVDYYHDELRNLIKQTEYWDHGNIELQEYLDNNTSVESQTLEFDEFYEQWESARQAGALANVHQNLHVKKVKALAFMLFASPARRKHYLKLINERLHCDSEKVVKPISIIELEQRYQYFLYKKGRKSRGFKISPTFETWRSTKTRPTFYDEL